MPSTGSPLYLVRAHLILVLCPGQSSLSPKASSSASQFVLLRTIGLQSSKCSTCFSSASDPLPTSSWVRCEITATRGRSFTSEDFRYLEGKAWFARMIELLFVCASGLGWGSWVRVRGRRLLFISVTLAHHDRRGRCPEAHDDAFNPLCACLRKPAAMLAAVGAVKLASMRSLAGADDAHVIAAWPLAIDGAIELNHQAVGLGCRDSGEHLELVLHLHRPPRWLMSCVPCRPKMRRQRLPPAVRQTNTQPAPGGGHGEPSGQSAGGPILISRLRSHASGAPLWCRGTSY